MRKSAVRFRPWAQRQVSLARVPFDSGSCATGGVGVAQPRREVQFLPASASTCTALSRVLMLRQHFKETAMHETYKSFTLTDDGVYELVLVEEVW